MYCVNQFFCFFFFLMIRRPPRSTLFPTRRSSDLFPPGIDFQSSGPLFGVQFSQLLVCSDINPRSPLGLAADPGRSEEHTSELQSLAYLVCRLLLEKKKNVRAHHMLASTDLSTPAY